MMGTKAAELAARISAQAHRVAVQGHAAEIAEAGVLPPCRNTDPLDPPLRLDEYAMMERDEGKYLMYWGAIHAAVLELAASTPAPAPLQAVVVGPGLGRLARYVLDAANDADLEVKLLLLEANPLCVEQLGHTIADDDRVMLRQCRLHPCHTFADIAALVDLPPEFAGGCQIAVSELLGCWGDNEFLPELATAINRIFLGPGGVAIPCAWSNYLAPISAPALHEYLQRTHRPQEATYVTGVGSDAVVLAEAKVAWTARCDSREDITPLGCRDLQFEVTADAVRRAVAASSEVCRVSTTEARVHGLLGYFTADLYNGLYVIDTRHSSPGFNAFHWEAFFFPIPEPLVVQSGGINLVAGVLRRTAPDNTTPPQQQGLDRTAGLPPSLRLWYEWTLDRSNASSFNDKRWLNIGGNTDCVRLRAALPEISEDSGLLEWLATTGAAVSAVNVGPDTYGGTGIFARTAVPSGGELLRCPVSTLLRPSTAFSDHAIGPALSAATAVNERVATCLLLLHHRRLGFRSSFAPYIASLPGQEITHALPAWWPESTQTALLGGTPLLYEARSHAATVKDDFAAVFDGPDGLSTAQPTLFPSNWFSFDDFRWADAIFWSRAIQVPFLSGKEECLVPLLDLCNHRAGSIAALTVESNDFVLRAGCEIERCQEIEINCGFLFTSATFFSACRTLHGLVRLHSLGGRARVAN